MMRSYYITDGEIFPFDKINYLRRELVPSATVKNVMFNRTVLGIANKEFYLSDKDAIDVQKDYLIWLDGETN